MGTGIAQVAAVAGHRVVLSDESEIALDKAKDNLVTTLLKLQEKGKLSNAEEILDRITYSDDPDALKDCGLVIEAVVEKLDVKQTLFKTIESVVSAECVLASNTSSLSITSIAAACNKPSRVIGLHFFNPAPLMALVEIIPAIQTDEDLLPAAQNLMKKWGKVAVIAKDTPGFIVNRLARPFYGEALRIHEEGFADIATIDWEVSGWGRLP